MGLDLRSLARPCAQRICAVATALLCASCGGETEGPLPLRVLLSAAPAELDPRFVSDAQSLRLSRLLFASLVRMDPKTLAPVLDLAESIEEEAPTRYRIRLLPGLHFSDGSALTAEDVVGTFEGVIDPALGSRYAGTYRRFRTVQALDDRTVMIALTEPHATVLTDLELPIVRAEDEARHLAWGEGASPPIGAGPFRVTEFSERSVLLEANPYWHRGRPPYPKVRLDVLRDENARALRLLAGEADIAMQALSPALVTKLAGGSDFRVKRAAGINTYYLGFQTEDPRLQDRRVRQGLSHALDRLLLLDTELAGFGHLADSWIPPGHWAHQDDLKQRPYDLQAARALLDAAGWSVDPSTGVRGRLVLRVSSDRFRVSLARAIAAMLRDVSVDVEVRPSEAAALIDDLNRGHFELCLLQFPELYEPHVLSWFFASTRIPEDAASSGANRWRFRHPAVDAFLEVGRRTTAMAARREAYGHVQRLLLEELPVVPLFHEDVVALTGPRAKSFWAPRDGRLDPLTY